MSSVPNSAPDIWRPVCRLEDVVPETGVAARFGDTQIAVFLFRGRVYAVGNQDPVTGAGVLSRGILGDRRGEPKITSPIYKESYSLQTGVNLDNETLRIPVYDVRVTEEGMIEVAVESGS